MPHKAAPAPYSQGELKTGIVQSKILGKKSYDLPSPTEQDITAETFKQTAYGIDKLHRVKTTVRYKPLTKACMISDTEGFLRDGYVTRRYSSVFADQMPEFPSPGQPITPIAAYPIKAFDDHTGQGTYKRIVRLDEVKFRGADMNIDVSKYQEYVDLHTTKTAEAKAREMNLMTDAFYCATFPSFTFTLDITLSRFLDNNNLKPESAPVSDYYDTTKNSLWKDFILKDIVGQAQDKLKNICRYAVSYWNSPLLGSAEVPEPKKVTKDEPSKDSIYLEKEQGGNKIQNKQHGRFASMLALTTAIRSKWIEMTTVDAVTNMASYDPYSEQAPTDFQDYGIASPGELRIVMNNHDYAFAMQGNTSTSGGGNYKVTLEDISSAGTSIYPSDILPPGTAIIEHVNTFKIVEFYDGSYNMKFEDKIAEQRGLHYMGRVAIQRGVQGCKLVPIDGFVPDQIFLMQNFKDIKTV